MHQLKPESTCTALCTPEGTLLPPLRAQVPPSAPHPPVKGGLAQSSAAPLGTERRGSDAPSKASPAFARASGGGRAGTAALSAGAEPAPAAQLAFHLLSPNSAPRAGKAAPPRRYCIHLIRWAGPGQSVRPMSGGDPVGGHAPLERSAVLIHFRFH